MLDVKLPALRWFSIIVATLAPVACGDDGGQKAASSSGSGGGGGSGGGASGGGATALSLPQFVRGAARVDATAFAKIPLVIAFDGAAPDTLEVTVGSAKAAAVRDGDRFVATIDAAALGDGAHPVEASATVHGTAVAPVKGTLSVASDSLQFTDFSKVGPAFGSHLVHDAKTDALELTWVSVAGGKHGLWWNELDGALARLHDKDLELADPADEPLDGHSAFAGDLIGVVYRTVKPGDGHWLVKMRVVDRKGAAVVDTMDLTEGQAAFTPTQAGADPNGFSGAWLHISPPNPAPPPLEVRFSRWDVAKKKLVGPVVIDKDHPQAIGSSQGPQALEPLAEIGIACNADICLVTFVRDVYIPLVDLNVPKLFVGVVDLESGALAGPPKPVEASDWDTQLFGQNVVALADGSFELVYTANDTAAAVTPKSPCDDTLERDLIFAVKIDKAGHIVGAPKPIFDFQGSREYPRIAPHPAGFAMLWEDQRSECGPMGHLRMAFDVVAPDASKLLDTYLEVPGSIGLPPEDPTLDVAGTNFVVGWSDDRHGGGVADPKPEIFFDTYWRK